MTVRASATYLGKTRQFDTMAEARSWVETSAAIDCGYLRPRSVGAAGDDVFVLDLWRDSNRPVQTEAARLEFVK